MTSPSTKTASVGIVKASPAVLISSAAPKILHDKVIDEPLHSVMDDYDGAESPAQLTKIEGDTEPEVPSSNTRSFVI